jgi:hypothetical protein
MYVNKFFDAVQMLGATPGTTGNTLGAAGSTGQLPYSWLALTPMNISRLFFRVTQAFATTAASAGTIPVQFVVQPVLNSTSASVVVGQLNIPTSAVLGTVYYKDIPPNTASTGVGAGLGSVGGGLVAPGLQVVVQYTAFPSSGGGIADFEAEYNPERPANWPVMSLST